ncbi:MSMEG_1061 family FMN-dependent PPOX-type flavoprotein [Gordonia hongkongensis]|uniref:MSMEG_1061 family FMN-dependent PPOX-type flavoprotein n=1 Tax=Gordonia hongkongensis TaxID=1701090 RepID=UPI001FFA3AB5|nr:MSMEG_1061 family FMN-dependent PPOX-type flavoprotein [Gordonia hongkongensis]UPG67179.1 pyridoxamine 5'-phosphate oxidase family protein [Gordonia hongkongensis]
MHITDESRLREIVGHPMELIRDKARNSLADVDREWLAESPMVFLATADELGRIDVSLKGDPAGKVVHVIDDRHIAIPERPGNRRVDGYVNILRNPNAGTIFVVPGRGDTLRINGRARIVDDADYFDDLTVSGKRPILAVEITVDEVFYHCPKAFLRSDLWKPDSWRPDALPSVAEITRRVMPEAGNERFTEDSFRPYLY